MSTSNLAFLLACAAASATFLGWALAASRRTWPPAVFGWTMLLAAAAMVAISSINLLPSAVESGLRLWGVAALAFGGAALVGGLRLIADRLDSGPSGGSLQRTAFVAAVAIGLHNIPEGAAPVGSTFLTVQAGVVVALAIGLHNIPEGIAVSAPVLAGGGSRARAFAFTAVATGGEILGAVIALTFADLLTPARIGGLLAFVAGVMITLSVVELIPAGIRLLRGTEQPQAEPGSDQSPRSATGQQRPA